MAIQKKHGKGRLDKWYKLAKEKGYRARAAFKLIQLNKKYNFLDNAKVCIDLCAAPGSWCQVAAEVMPQNSIIIGCDLAPIKAIPRCITFQSDITTEDCRSKLRGHLKHWKADVVLHDGAPNVGTAWVQDAFTQAELALQSMKLATEFLREGGTFVTKVFRSRDFNSLMWVFNQLFDHVDATKPPSSRNVSAEIFVVCRGYKAPKKLDPKFVDPRTVFEELPDATPNNEAKVFKPELKKRKRDGYEEGEHLQFKEVPVSEFIETTDPIQLLGSINKISLFAAKDDLTAQAINKLPETTEEVRACCADLKVLGKKDFRLLLKWRISCREKFGLSLKKVDPNKKVPEPEKTEQTEETEVTEMDEELQIEKDLQALKEKETTKKKKEKRKSNEAKRKEIVRLQMNMATPMDIGMEQQGADGDQEFFGLRKVDKLNAVNVVAKGKMNMVVEEDTRKDKDFFFEEELEEETDDEEDRLERELDGMYEVYVERKAEADAKFRAKRARKVHEDGEWHGFGEEEEEEESDGEVSRALVESDISDSSDDEDEEETGPLIKTLNDDDAPTEEGLSKKAKLFFDQDIFAGLVDEEGESEEEDEEMTDVKEVKDAKKEKKKEKKEKQKAKAAKAAEEAGSDVEMGEGPEVDAGNDSDYETEDDDGMVVVRTNKDDTEWDSKPDPMKNGRIDIDIVTAEAMTLAHELATGKRSKEQLIDEGFNKMAFRDVDGLPEWFLDDETRHSKQLRPISKAAADAIKEKNKAMNARPIKKVREAKARKKFKLHQRMEKMKKKSSALADEEGVSEKEKASSIMKLMAKATKKRPKKHVTVVVATGPNKGNGRPKGTKGKYKMVDARLKKDVRAMKRVAKKAKKGRK